LDGIDRRGGCGRRCARAGDGEAGAGCGQWRGNAACVWPAVGDRGGVAMMGGGGVWRKTVCVRALAAGVEGELVRGEGAGGLGFPMVVGWGGGWGGGGGGGGVGGGGVRLARRGGSGRGFWGYRDGGRDSGGGSREEGGRMGAGAWGGGGRWGGGLGWWGRAAGGRRGAECGHGARGVGGGCVGCEFGRAGWGGCARCGLGFRGRGAQCRSGRDGGAAWWAGRGGEGGGGGGVNARGPGEAWWGRVDACRSASRIWGGVRRGGFWGCAGAVSRVAERSWAQGGACGRLGSAVCVVRAPVVCSSQARRWGRCGGCRAVGGRGGTEVYMGGAAAGRRGV